VPRTEEEYHSRPRHPSATWSTEGGRCKDRSRQLHHHGGHVRGLASPRRYVFNEYPTVVLFNSGATHNFISRACTQRYQLSIQHVDTPYLISTPGGRVVTKQIVMHTPLNLAGKFYKPSLIILDGQGLDIILGMGWMRAHKALLDTATRVVHFDSPIHGIHVLQLS
jgi:hypothetical protein